MRPSLLLAFALVAGQDASSKQPPAKATVANSRPQADQRGTPQTPLVIQVASPPQDTAEARQRRRAEDEKAHNESLIAKGTVALAAVTFLLVGVTGVLARYTFRLWQETKNMAAGTDAAAKEQVTRMEASIREAARAATAMEATAKEMHRSANSAAISARAMEDSASAMDRSANAAAASAEAAMASERAYVLLDAGRTASGNNGFQALPGMVYRLCFTNFGRTPAQIEVVTASCAYWADITTLRELEEHPPEVQVPLEGVWLAAGGWLGDRLVQIRATREDVAAANDDNGWLAILGRVIYKDVFDTRREFGYAILLQRNGAFAWLENGNLNYSR